MNTEDDKHSRCSQKTEREKTVQKIYKVTFREHQMKLIELAGTLKDNRGKYWRNRGVWICESFI